MGTGKMKNGKAKKRKYAAVEKRLAKEIREIEAMLFFRPRLPAMKLWLNWEKAARPSASRLSSDSLVRRLVKNR